MAKNKKYGKNTTDPDEAIAGARAAGAELKSKDEALYWASMAQVLLLGEIRDMMREDRANRGSVELPDEAPPRETAHVTVVEE